MGIDNSVASSIAFVVLFMDPSTWGLHSNGFNSCVTAWNIGVRKIIGLPYTTHTWMLGPLTNSVHMKYKLYIRDLKFLTWFFSMR